MKQVSEPDPGRATSRFLWWVVALTVVLLTADGWAKSNEPSPADIAYQRTMLEHGSRIFYGLLEDIERAEFARLSPNILAETRAVELADARMNFVLEFPEDPRAWLVAGYLFLPPLDFDLAARVAFVSASHRRVAAELSATRLSSKMRAVVLVVDVCHELDRVKHSVFYRNEPADFSVLRAKMTALADYAPTDYSLPGLNRALADLTAKAEENSLKRSGGTADSDKPSPPVVAWSLGEIPEIDSSAIPQFSRIFPCELGEIHERCGKNYKNEGCGRTAVFRIQERVQLDALLMIENIIRKYPESPEIPALTFRYTFTTPDFIADYPDEITQNDPKPFYRWPRDQLARNRWLETGNQFVADIVRSPKWSPKQKDQAESSLFFRDLRNATFGWEKNPDWPGIQDRLERHVSKWGELGVVGKRIESFLEIIDCNVPTRPDFELTTRALSAMADPRVKIAVDEYVAKKDAATWVGRFAPPVQFVSFDGQPIDLEKLRGRVVLLDFWATWCGPCVAAMPKLKVLYEKYRSAGFEVIGISGDNCSRNSFDQFLEQGGYEWPQYFDGNGRKNAFTELFRVKSWPTVFLIGKDGIVIASHTGGKDLEPQIRRALGL